MRFRQVHLDFHTSEAIEGIGEDFNKSEFQATLKAGHVDSITLFSKCHHGWAYHPSKANTTHPHLKFDLLGAQIEAAHEIGVKTPVYLSAGFDEKLAAEHMSWLVRDKNGSTGMWSQTPFQTGYRQFCMNSPYLDILLAQIAEVVEKYDCDGIFLDIVGVRQCYCPNCMKSMLAKGFDPEKDEDVIAHGREVYLNYTKRVEETIHSIKPDMPIFHNSGHIVKGDHYLPLQNSHLELESLPTGGYGYDHFPMSARYVAANYNKDFLGMTGKFHTHWGEFGGYKYKNALRYEVAIALANGAASSVGDQLHPRGRLDPATYELIGAAYAESEQKEPWVKDTKYIADVGILSQEAYTQSPLPDFSGTAGDTGASRCFMEEHIMFDVLDLESDFNKYKVVVLPDNIRLDGDLEARLNDYIAQGGKILASGTSGLKKEADEFAIDLGVKFKGKCHFKPTYIHPFFKTDYITDADYIVYEQAYEIEGTENIVAERHNPYFNTNYRHFCSHQHAPVDTSKSYPAVVCGKNGAYISWNIFSDYATVGAPISRHIVSYVIKQLLGDRITFISHLPSQGYASVTEGKDFYATHLVYGSPVKRGNGICVVEDIIPLYNTEVSLSLPAPVKKAVLVPQMEEIPFEYKDGRLCFTVPKIDCHQMVALYK